jgi:RHS repeat-associated protein
MNLFDRVNRQRSLTAISRTRRSGRVAANASVATTTYAYDANGNLVQAGGWSYMWDYLNRMLSSGFNNSTTTYAYDEFGSRVMQTSTTSTTYYPNKYYSLTSTKIGANTYATSTNYVWNGDTLLATIDQMLYNGTATGSPITRYIHPDHLGSTNAVTDQNGSLVQLMDYYPYGATRISTSTYPTNEKRQYIGQFSDAQTNLNYLNARYYNPTQGQFLSEDPVSWGAQNIANPQSLNMYSYAQGNPIRLSDPMGLSVFDYAANPIPANGFDYGMAIGTYKGIPIYSHGDRAVLADNNTYQCVEFVDRYFKPQGANLYGNGNGSSYANQTKLNTTLSNNGSAGYFFAYPNGSDVMPQENDILSWSDNGGAGHVGLIVDVRFNSQTNTGTVFTVDQNVKRYKALFAQALTRDQSGAYSVQSRLPGYQVQGWARYGQAQMVSSINASQSQSGLLQSLKNALVALSSYLKSK